MTKMWETLQQHRVIPVVEIDDADDAVALAEALLAGGIAVIEITLRTEQGLRAIESISRNCPDLLAGAGTVLSANQAADSITAGAKFGVSPGLTPQVVEFFADRDTPFLPGVMTPTEVGSALSLGCRYLKFFPAGPAGGPGFLKALGGPYGSHGIEFCATGGVSLANMNDYLALPQVRAIGGSWIATRQQIADKDWAGISQRAGDALKSANQIAS